MTAVSITAANVAAGSNASQKSGIAGATITAGQVLYYDSATTSYKLADTDGATALRTPAGIALHGASSGQPITMLTKGLITIGGTVTAGTPYFLGATAGTIVPFADLTTGAYPCFLGIATTSGILNINITESSALI